MRFAVYFLFRLGFSSTWRQSRRGHHLGSGSTLPRVGSSGFLSNASKASIALEKPTSPAPWALDGTPGRAAAVARNA
jgi:hypothetical protein